MAVKIRLKRLGRKNRAEFRIVAADAHAPRDGAVLEVLGLYHPREAEPDKVVRLDATRVHHWLSVGAQPTETVMSILKRNGIKLPWVERANEKRKKEVEERRARKIAAGRVQPSRPSKPKAAKALPAEAAATIDERLKAAETKAGRRAARKAR